MKNEIKLGSFLSYMQMALSIIIGLIYTPVMINLLGQSEYGLYNTVVSIISMLSLLSFGFNSGYIRFYARYCKENNKEKIYKLNGLFLIIFVVIGIISFACGIYLSGNLELIFKNGLTEEEYGIARILMVISAISLALSFINSVFTSIILAHEKFVFQKLINIVTVVIGPMITLPILLMGYRSIALVSVSLFLTCVSIIINIYYVLLKLKQKFWFSNIEKKLFLELFSYTIFIFLNMVIDQINWNIDKLLLGRFQGTTAVAIYSVGFALYSYYQSFSVSVSNVFTPRIHKIVNSTIEDSYEQKLQLTSLFIKVGRIQFLILGLIVTGFIFFGRIFIVKIWTSMDYNDSYYIALLLMVPATIALIQNLGIEIQRAENKHQFRSIVYTLMAAINLCISVALCRVYGAIGCAIGTAFSLILANGLIMNVYYHKRCNIDILLFWRNIAKLSCGMLIPILCGVAMVAFLPYVNIGIYILEIIIYTIIYILSMYMIGMNQYEIKLLRNAIKEVLRIVCRRSV